MSKQQTPVMFLDFDGTITKRDVIDAILEQYADERWLQVEDEWRAGRIGSRICLSEQIALVRATVGQVDELLDSIELDEGLHALLQTCAAHHIATHIISDGFDCCIRRILARTLNNFSHREMRICASQLESRGNHEWTVSFPFFAQSCAHGCATCKPAVMSLLNRANVPTIFVGDGLSDRYAAGSANLVFAKKGLAEYCLEEQIAHVTYNNLGDVASNLETALRRGVDFATKELIESVGA